MTKLSEIKTGDILIAGDRFTCLHAGQRCEAKRDEHDDLYVDCKMGRHALGGQTDDDGNLVGLIKEISVAKLLVA